MIISHCKGAMVQHARTHTGSVVIYPDDIRLSMHINYCAARTVPYILNRVRSVTNKVNVPIKIEHIFNSKLHVYYKSERIKHIPSKMGTTCLQHGVRSTVQARTIPGNIILYSHNKRNARNIQIVHILVYHKYIHTTLLSGVNSFLL